MKKLVSLALSLMMLVSLFAACGVAAAEAAPLEGEITFWHSFTQGPRMESIQKSAADFMAANPGVKITIETFSWADFYTKWTTGLASGNVPDMSTALPNHVVEMIDADAVIPLDDLIDGMGRERFYEAPLTEMSVDGKCYALPLYSHAQVMWYRKDLLEKYKLDVPQTWEQFYEACKLINEGEKGEVYGTAVPLGM
ncbi:MAG: extracellular solute-binding protein, partial [Clostridia bacterium]